MGEPKRPLTGQQDILMKEFKAGRSLTVMVAHTCYGIASLTSRVAELRKLGYNIEDEWRTDRFDRRYQVYFIREYKDAAERDLPSAIAHPNG